jgi:hypothetical protein
MTCSISDHAADTIVAEPVLEEVVELIPGVLLVERKTGRRLAANGKGLLENIGWKCGRHVGVDGGSRTAAAQP